MKNLFGLALAAGLFANGASALDTTFVNVANFASMGYNDLYTLSYLNASDQIANASTMFVSDEAHQSYVASIEASGLRKFVEMNQGKTTVSTGAVTVVELPSGDWEAKFPSTIFYEGYNSIELCLDVTAKVRGAYGVFDFVNVVSVMRKCG